MSTIADKVVAIHAALAAAEIPHAFGGALALAWCTERARGTIDIDLNIFVSEQAAATALAALPARVRRSETDQRALERDGQARLWWDETPIDVFLSTTEFHEQVAGRAHFEEFAGAEVPFLSCADLAVFKAFFDRTRDWADLEEMAAIGSLDVDRVIGVLTRYLGAGDPRIARLARLA